MGQLVLTGSLTIGPPVVSDSTFPGAQSTVSLNSNPSPKPSQVDSGIKSRNLNSPNAFATLSGIGANDDVTQGDTLYFRCRSPMQIRITTANPLQPNSPTVSVIPVNGIVLLEFPSSSYLMLLEVQGVGQIEYLGSGQQ